MTSRKPLGVAVAHTKVGRGVIATRSFRRNQYVGPISGTVVKGGAYDPCYVMDLGEFGVLEPSEPFRFLNHSCEPNAELVLDEAKNPPELWLAATATIREGDQLTIDYAWPAELDALTCHCESDRCRGYIVAEEELAALRRIQARRKRRRSRAS